MTHVLALIFVSVVVALSFAFLMRETIRERIFFGIKMFLGLVGFAFIAGWIAMLLH